MVYYPQTSELKCQFGLSTLGTWRNKNPGSVKNPFDPWKILEIDGTTMELRRNVTLTKLRRKIRRKSVAILSRFRRVLHYLSVQGPNWRLECLAGDRLQIWPWNFIRSTWNIGVLELQIHHLLFFADTLFTISPKGLDMISMILMSHHSNNPW